MLKKQHRQFYPQLGWVEHDAGELLDRVHSAAEAVGDIAALERTRQLDPSVPTRQGLFRVFEEFPLLAISRHSEGSSRTSALPPLADIVGARTLRTQKADIGCLLNPRKQT